MAISFSRRTLLRGVSCEMLLLSSYRRKVVIIMLHPKCRTATETLTSYRCRAASISISDRGIDVCLFATASRPALGPNQLPIKWVSEALSLRVKRPGRKADHSPTSRAEVKNTWSYTYTPPYAFRSWYFAKHRDKFGAAVSNSP